MKTRSLAALAAPAALVAALAQGAEPRPLRAPIVIDGQFDDWIEVLTNPTNTTRDGYGGGSDCALSTDLDCPVTSLDADLERFAWTWDDTTLYVFIERFQDRPSSEGLVLYLDLDRSGRMETGEPLIDIKPDQLRDRALEKKTYVSVDPTGDPLTAPSGPNAGQADGWTLPGTAVAGLTFGDLLKDVPAAAFEAALPWTDLGLTGPTAFEFHVTASNGDIPSADADNLGRPDGSPTTTAFAAVALAPPRELSTAAGVPVRLRHVVTNDGTEPGRLRLAAISSVGWDLTWLADLDGDGLFDDTLALDARGDGLFTLPGDFLAPEGDENGDGLLDTGLLGAFESVEVEIELVPPVGSEGVVERLDVRVGHDVAPSVAAGLEDLVRVGDLTLHPERRVLAVAGDDAWLPHVVTSHLSSTDLVDLSVLSGSGWSYELLADPDGDGDPADATPLVDSDGSGEVDVTLAPGEQFSLLVRAAVPQSAPIGTTETAFVRALLRGLPLSVVVDEIEVAPPLQLLPDHLLLDGNARYGANGGAIWFAHRLIHAQGFSDDVSLAAISDLGWPTALLLDPDGDGRPFDARALAPGPVRLGANGDELALLLRVDIPPGTPLRELSRIDLTATSVADPTVTAAAADDAVAAIVRVYEDALHVVNLTRAAPCSTVHAVASGLEASSLGFRFAWFDGAGGLVRQVDVGTDLAGETSDVLSLGPDEVGPGWRVEVQADDGMGWAARDAAGFDVVDSLVTSSLVIETPTVHLVGRTVSARANLMNEDFDQSLADVSLRWVVLTPDRASYLDPAGSFQAYTGTEATRTEALALAARESRALRLDLVGVNHLGQGLHVVELWRAVACAGVETLLAASSYEVIDDEDGDGVPRSVEEAAGTDPRDADSDDDGLLDGDDGLGDSDGDGAVDALDCDSDGDGLTDGLEAGVFLPHADTDPATGCFTPDADPTSVTDPDDADTDDGGVPDGVEDANADGRRDGAELDPNDPSDDAGACAGEAPPEVTGLRARRVGTDAELTWDLVTTDLCSTHSVIWSEALPGMPGLVSGVIGTSYRESGPTGTLRFYRVRAVSSLHGPGPD